MEERNVPPAISTTAAALPPPPASVSRRPRGQNWTWYESFALIKMVRATGKNWENALNRLHAEQHILGRITEPDKLRQHYNQFTRTDSVLKKPYLTPPVVIKNKHELPPNEIARLEAEHAAKHQQIREEREQAATLVQEIEEHEHAIFSSKEKGNTDKFRTEIQEKESDRKVWRKQKTDTIAVAAIAETKQKAKVTAGIDAITKVLSDVGDTMATVAKSLAREPSESPLLLQLLAQNQEMMHAIQALQEQHPKKQRGRKRKRKRVDTDEEEEREQN